MTGSHGLWPTIKRNVTDLEASAPDGYEAVVHVYLTRRAEPVEIGIVETSHDPDKPWVLLHSASASESPPPDLEVVFVDEQYVERVEIHYRRKGRPRRIGFEVRHMADDSSG